MTPGQMLGHYRVLERLGAGGMGVVYKAHDTRLNRTVAIKVLPAQAVSDPERRARFLQEARAASALDHPHIVTIYELAEAEGQQLIVMQYVPGKTLRQLLAGGGLPLNEALRYAMQIADGLSRAHAQGIVHRDLKPENVIVSEQGQAKILDFGLAKLMDSPETSEAPTEGQGPPQLLTQEGHILGTTSYMSPEQAQGKKVDLRSDLFSFGSLLYEMLTGQRAFPGASHGEVMAAVIRAEPPLPSTLRKDVPATLDVVIRRCLAKDPDERWQSASDVGHLVRWAFEAKPRLEAAASGRRFLPLRSALALALGGLALGASAVGLVRWLRQAPSPTPQNVRFRIDLPAEEALLTYASASVAISPDGSRIAYVASRQGGRGVFIRELDALESSWVPGTEGASSPFFSPDGRWLGFEAGNRVKKVALTGGAPQFVVTAPWFAGASWGPDDTIVYVPAFTSGLWKVSAQGGAPTRLTEPDGSLGEPAHAWPQFLPGGKAVLFTVWTGADFDQSRIAVLSLASGERRTLVNGGFYARYLPGGHIAFARGGRLLAAPFDLERLEVTGEAVPVVDGVFLDAQVGVGFLDVSQTGVLVYAPGAYQEPLRSLLWVERNGRTSALSSQTLPFTCPRISPDGRRVAVEMETTPVSLWVYDLAREALTRVSFGEDDHSPAWSPDGRRIAFESGRGPVHQLFVRASDGTGEDLGITSGALEHYLCDWSADGRLIAYVEYHPETSADLWLVEPDGERTARPFLKTRFFESEAAFSPDGRSIAYVSDESGRDEVYVRPLEGGGKVQVSVDGGTEPAWARSGAEIYYRSGGRMMVVPVRTTAEISAGRPVALFEGAYHYNKMPSRTYDVAADGRFVMVKAQQDGGAPRQLHVTTGWGEELSRRTRAPGR